MNDKIIISKNVIIAFLLLTAVLFSCTWALISESATSSSPVGATSRAGYYIVATTAAPTHGPDLLWIANVDTQELVIYGTSTDGSLTLLASADLNRAFLGRISPSLPPQQPIEGPESP